MTLFMDVNTQLNVFMTLPGWFSFNGGIHKSFPGKIVIKYHYH